MVFNAFLSSSSDRKRMQVTCAPDEPQLFWLGEKPKHSQFERHAGIKVAQVLGSPLYVSRPHHQCLHVSTSQGVHVQDHLPPLQVYDWQPIKHAFNLNIFGSLIHNSNLIFDPMMVPGVMTKSEKELLHGLLFESWKRPGEKHQSPSQAKLGFSTPPVTVFLWTYLALWRTKSGHLPFATPCYRIMLNSKRLDSVNNERIYPMTSTQQCKAV